MISMDFTPLIFRNGMGFCRLIICATGMMALTGCGALGGLVRVEDPPLAGERISVLSDSDGLTPDAAIADEQVNLPRPRLETEWLQQGGSPTHVMAHGLISDVPERIWSVDIGKGSNDDAQLLSGPILVNGAVYTIDTESVVTAVDGETGNIYWQVETELDEEKDGSWGGGIASDGHLLYVTTGFAAVIAIDASTGDEIWRTAVSGPMRSSATIHDGTVFVITKDNKLHALTAATGELLWEHSGRLGGAGLLGASSPAVFGDVVIAAYSSGEIFALNTRTGSEFWSDSLASVRRLGSGAGLSDIRARPVISGRRVFVASRAGRMAAISLSTGQRIWELGLSSVTQPWVADEYVFVVTDSGEVAAVKASSGLVRWVTHIGQYENEKRQRGRIRWVGPILASDRLIVAGSNGEILSLSPYTGELTGVIEAEGGVSLAPVIANETLYILTDSGRLVAYR